MAKKNNGKAVYDFLGFKLLDINYKRYSNNDLKEFGTQIINSKYDQKRNLHQIMIEFNLMYDDGDQSTFLFASGFQVNDTKWYESFSDNQIDSLFFSVVFPYIREKIQTITDDDRGNALIPILDLRNVDMKKGITYTKKDNSKN